MTIIKQTPRQLHELHQVPEAMEYASIVHQYVELTQLWRTVGYRCKRCDIAFKNKNVLINHINTCRVINSISNKKEKE